VHRLTQLKIIVRKVSYTKPYLTEENKVTRLEYALSLRAGDTVVYQDLYNYIHVDEKWFYLTETGEAYYCAPDEDLPHRTVKSKRFIKKVMFLCAQARPRRLPNGEWWDGKIGIWPIGEVGKAKQGSKNRPKGAPVWENTNVTRDIYREMMINKVLPALVEKFPHSYLNPNKGVIIQQDGAKSHILEDDEEWLEAVEALQVNVKLVTQPANSPDTNINDLAFFNSIQSLYHEAAPGDEFDMIKAVEKAYNDYPVNKINRMWLTLQSVCNEIIEHNGDNDYSIPHLRKEALEREGRLPKVLQVLPEAKKFDTPSPHATRQQNNP